MRRGKSTEIALCGMMTALAVVILCLGGLIPAATFCCPVLASLVLLPVMQRWGRRDAVLVWAASAILGLLLGPDKEAAALYAALGYYPAIRAGLDRKRPALRWALKLLLFNGATIALYALLIFVLGLNALVEEYRATGTALLIATLALGNVVFVIYDFLLKRLERVLAARKRRTAAAAILHRRGRHCPPVDRSVICFANATPPPYEGEAGRCGGVKGGQSRPPLQPPRQGLRICGKYGMLR